MVLFFKKQCFYEESSEHITVTTHVEVHMRLRSRIATGVSSGSSCRKNSTDCLWQYFCQAGQSDRSLPSKAYLISTAMLSELFMSRSHGGLHCHYSTLTSTSRMCVFVGFLLVWLLSRLDLLALGFPWLAGPALQACSECVTRHKGYLTFPNSALQPLALDRLLELPGLHLPQYSISDNHLALCNDNLPESLYESLLRGA
jgi:hypothetical protein